MLRFLFSFCIDTTIKMHAINVNEEISPQTSTSQEGQKLLEELNGKENQAENWGKLQKVPGIMRENENKREYFKPREISVGPIHAGDSDLSKRELKAQLAKKLIKNSNKPAEIFLENIKNNSKFLRKFFGKGIADSYTDDDLACLLFLDGCAVLQFIYSWNSGNLKDFNISSIQATLIQQDLFLFENQLPFEVLKLLMTELINETEKEESFPAKGTPFSYAIVKFVVANNICAPTEEIDHLFDFRGMVGVLDKKKPDHLLDLLRMVSVFGSLKVDVEDRDDQESLIKPILHPPKSFLSRLACFSKPRQPNIFDDVKGILKIMCRNYDRTFRTVQELKSSGIKMMPSNSRSLRSVSFSTHCFGFRGHLKLPTLVVDDSTVRKLLNLVAYETCLDDNNKRRVTSYLNFLDLLIDTEQDAKDLRAAHVLRNRLSSDDEVAQLFNTIGSTYLISQSQDYYYAVIKNQIEKHFNRNLAIWLAQLYNDHFSNPVTIVALVAAAVALALTIVQTVYAVNPKE